MWLTDLLQEALVQKHRTASYPLLREVKAAFPGKPTEFALLMRDSSWKKIRAAGLLLV
jgi:hypothetical protein